MKYFTPELCIQLQNVRDEEACQEWDRRADLYAKELTVSMPKFSKSVKLFAEKFNLHDAAVKSVTLSGKTLSMVLHPDYPGAGLVQLSYILWESPQVLKGVLPPEHRSYPTYWLYDEIGIGLATPGNGVSSGELPANPVFTHNILLSDGWEIRLRFKKLRISHPQAVVPVSAYEPMAVPPPA